MRKFIFVVCVCCYFIPGIALSQSHIFLVFHSGSYMDKINKEPELVMNAGIGYEHDLADKLSISLSFRRLFYLAGIDDVKMKNIYEPGIVSADWRDTYTGNAFDYESKYFFETADDGGYFSAGISLQMMTANVDIMNAEDLSGGSNLNPVKVGVIEKTFNLFPVTFKLGKRYSNDTVNSDLFIGYTFNLGSGQHIGMPYSEWLTYDKPNSNTLIVGFSSAIKF